ncbi:MAG: FAD-dependent oxidoreductase [Pseudomonadales bacterium]
MSDSEAVPRSCDTVIIGGGIIGCSIAYHLALAGHGDVVLLERGQLTCGTTWHAAGLVAQLRATANLTRLARYSRELYQSLEAQGFATGYKDVGALTLSTGAERSIEIRRQASMATQLGVECQWLSPGAIAERWPFLNNQDLDGGLYLPHDGQTNPIDTTRALASAAKAKGATICEDTAVERLLTASGAVIGVATTAGDIQCRRVVMAAGLWSRQLALDAGVNLPLHAAEHFYAVTEPMALPADAPIVRAPDAGIYLKPDVGRMLVGCFERDAKPIRAEQLPADFAFDELPFDLEHFAPYFSAACERVPALNNVGVRTWFNGPESFTPDGRYILGPTPELSGLFAACGFNSIGIQSAGGVGQVVAQWLLEDAPPMDLWDVDVRRFMPHQNEDRYLTQRTSESLGLLYAMHWPHRQYRSGREVQCTPVHEQTTAAGAVFGEVAGWERPNWYAPAGTPAEYQYSYGRQNWFEHVAREHHATRTSVALFDQSSFSKYAITGPDACAFLNRLCTANMDVAINQAVYCQWLNERGGIEADITVTRCQQDSYWVVSAAASRTRDLAWLERWRSGFDIEVADISCDYAVFGVMGPNAREHLLQCFAPLAPALLDDSAHPFGHSAVWTLCGTAVRALRITYVGTLGWEMYVPWDRAADVFAALNRFDIQLAGYHAMDSLRLEKGYRHWGHDITDEDTPLQAGLGFTIDWQKSDGFIGQSALALQKSEGVGRYLLAFALTDPEPLLLHDEPIWLNQQAVGRITSGAYGHTIGTSVGLGYVKSTEKRNVIARADFSIEIAGEHYAARATTRPWVDPSNRAIGRQR